MARKKAQAAESTEQVHHLFSRNEPPDIERVPTVPELYAHGLASVVAYTDKGVATHYRVKPEGQQLINDAMKRNAGRRKAWTGSRAGN